MKAQESVKEENEEKELEEAKKDAGEEKGKEDCDSEATTNSDDATMEVISEEAATSRQSRTTKGFSETLETA